MIILHYARYDYLLLLLMGLTSILQTKLVLASGTRAFFFRYMVEIIGQFAE